jgi:hypothetical protein
MQHENQQRRAYVILIALLAAVGGLLTTAPLATAANFSWSGEGSASADTWSNGANWMGGVAPATSSTVGTLTFPVLTSGACSAAPPTAACYATNNDVSGLTIEHLQLSNQATEPYVVSGDGITLGSGGLSASPPSSQNVGNVSLLLPITLGSSQTWNLTGSAGGGRSAGGGNVTAEGLSGSSADLTVNLEDGSGLYLKRDNEVGDVTVNGMNGTAGSINLYGEPSHVYKLDATDGHTLTVNNGVDFLAVNAAVGGYDSVGAETNVGRPFGSNPGTLSTTSVQLDAKSSLAFEIAAPGSTVGIDYGQLASTGEVALNNATLSLSETLPSGQCPALPVGQDYTLISTVGSLSGTFDNAPNGSIISDEGNCHNTYRINYNTSSSPQTVTATVVSSGGMSPPTSFTWSGGGGAANEWSNAANWVGGIAPTAGSTIGSLTFPLLAKRSVVSDNLSGLTINHIGVDVTNGYAINDGAISDEPITLGGGGLEVTESPSGGQGLEIYAPIKLGGNQTWNLSGGVTTLGALSGNTSNLTVNLLTPGIGFSMGRTDTTPDSELGNIAVTGLSSKPGSALPNGFFLESALNVTDGNTLTLENVSFLMGAHGSTGPLVSIASALELAGSSIGSLTSIGSHLIPGRVLHLPSASFDAASAVEFGVGGQGTEAGTDFTQLDASGSVALGGSTLELNDLVATFQSGTCAPPIGEVYTIISTTGTLSGTFGNAPNGGVISASECLDLGPLGEVLSESAPAFRINYNTGTATETVTATVTEEPPSTSGSKNGGGGTSGGSGASSGGSSSTGSSGGSSPAASISTAQIAALLGQQLIPSGKAAKIATLLKSGGLKMSFKALEAGTLSVQWYELSAGAKLAKHSKAKPVLVASGQTTFSAVGMKTLRIRLTAAGRKLLKHTKSIRLTVKGKFTATGQAPVVQTVSFALRH